MARKKKVKILFIGNSHTYYHDLPAWVALMAKEEGYECDVTMLAHGGWYLHQHVEEPDVRFNIKFGHYDYVVLQEHSHPFDDVPGYIENIKFGHYDYVVLQEHSHPFDDVPGYIEAATTLVS